MVCVSVCLCHHIYWLIVYFRIYIMRSLAYWSQNDKNKNVSRSSQCAQLVVVLDFVLVCLVFIFILRVLLVFKSKWIGRLASYIFRITNNWYSRCLHTNDGAWWHFQRISNSTDRLRIIKQWQNLTVSRPFGLEIEIVSLFSLSLSSTQSIPCSNLYLIHLLTNSPTNEKKIKSVSIKSH